MHIPIALRWGDLDAYNHVNNVRVFQLLEEARIRALWNSAEEGQPAYETAVFQPGGESMTVVAGQQIEYVRPIDYQTAPVDVQLWFTRLGGASVTIAYEVVAGPQPTVCVRATTTVVLIDAATMKPRRLTDTEISAWKPYVGEPIVFAGSK